MRPSNAESEPKRQICDRTRERGAAAAGENAERGKATKMRPSNAEIEQKLPKCDRRMRRESESVKYAIVRENGGQWRRGRMRREEKLPKCERRMRRASESSKNAIVRENGGSGGGGECGERKSYQNVNVECGERANVAKMRSYAKTGAAVAGENAERGKATKMRPSNAEIEQKLPKCDRRMRRGSESSKMVSYAITGCSGGVGECRERKSCQNATVECSDCVKVAKMRLLNAMSERKPQKCDRTRERGAVATCENAEREKLPKCDRQMLSGQKLSKCDHTRGQRRDGVREWGGG